MPVVRAAGGPSELVLIGSEPTAAITAAARLQDGVRLTGAVEDVIPELQQAGVLVVPLRAGGGTRIKILEAMAAGVPVISTPLGLEGLGRGIRRACPGGPNGRRVCRPYRQLDG